jgi:AraC-like DNA-binding protein
MSEDYPFPLVTMPRQREHIESGTSFSRHRHTRGHVSIILSGGFEEAGDHGRIRVEAGHVLLHGPFSGHTERAMRSTKILNLELPERTVPHLRWGFISDTDSIVRCAERDAKEALFTLLEQLQVFTPSSLDWPDLLANSIASGSAANLQQWADEHQIHPSSLARGFRQLYGVTPARFRIEQRARIAWEQIVSTRVSLSEIAHGLGFSDQAHMCRDVGAWTGRSPGAWRRLKIVNT